MLFLWFYFFGWLIAQENLWGFRDTIRSKIDEMSKIKEFGEFSKFFARNYSSVEEKSYREKIFAQELEMSNLLNEMHKMAHFGVNKFSDMGDEEFKNSYTMKGEVIDSLERDLEKKINSDTKNQTKNERRLRVSPGGKKKLFMTNFFNMFGRPSYAVPQNSGAQQNSGVFGFPIIQNIFGTSSPSSSVPIAPNVYDPSGLRNIYETSSTEINNESEDFVANSKKAFAQLKASYNEADLESQINKHYFEISEFLPMINWKLVNLVTSIKDQGRCAACYAYSSIASLEALMIASKSSKRPLQLSEQEIIECSSLFKNKGCEGGLSVFTYNYIQEKGINAFSDYKPVHPPQSCKNTPAKQNPFKDLMYIVMNPNVLSLLKGLQYGPVAINLSITKPFKAFTSGIIGKSVCEGAPQSQTHSVLVIGYNLAHSEPYFIMKNSWGEAWGEKGFFNIAIGELSTSNTGFCNIASKKVNVLPFLVE